jgi:hypothetical protein
MPSFWDGSYFIIADLIDLVFLINLEVLSTSENGATISLNCFSMYKIFGSSKEI